MRGLASAQVSPGAETCVLVGAMDGVSDLSLGGYRAVLWFPRTATPASAVQLDPLRTRIEPVDQFDASRSLSSLDALIQSDPQHLPSVFVSDEAVGTDAPLFLPVIEALFARLESHQRARLTRQQDGFLWQCHVLANLSGYVQRRLPPAWQGALAGVPAFVCGAGPSLETSLPALARGADRAVLFAADSALRVLHGAGIDPDFTVSVDAAKEPARCLVPGLTPAGRVVVATVSPPTWQDAVPADRLLFLSAKQLTEDALALAGIPKSPVSVDENCGITALGLAHFLGCSPIYLFGMDHAVDAGPGGGLHQRDANPGTEAHLGFQAGRNYPKVPGNYQAEIATPLFREWCRLDALCTALPAGLVHNVIDRGARLGQATLVHPTRFEPPSGRPKAAALSGLAAAPAMAVGDWTTLVRSLHRLAVQAAGPIQAARLALRADLPGQTAARLADLFRRREFGLLFGNYSLRVMPHLVRPAETDRALWAQVLAECDELLTLARAVR